MRAPRSRSAHCIDVTGWEKSRGIASGRAASARRVVSTTRWPRQRRVRVTALPMQPLDPQTRMFMVPRGALALP